ncbi:MAG: hypothetical protein EBV32_05330 [Proteobacteria bacterium]|uniref:Uncharacterized protein n=1 Tax=Candidatus Fonsibacter lacus TaxID=2576439 RepID=A0A964XS99_9PROT|nr:hypothetical protein [Candidatus Fonsibacter lacus]NCU72565.1 hypothetical protein [Candidatus Fonsibacter lacus]
MSCAAFQPFSSSRADTSAIQVGRQPDPIAQDGLQRGSEQAGVAVGKAFLQHLARHLPAAHRDRAAGAGTDAGIEGLGLDGIAFADDGVSIDTLQVGRLRAALTQIQGHGGSLLHRQHVAGIGISDGANGRQGEHGRRVGQC